MSHATGSLRRIAQRAGALWLLLALLTPVVAAAPADTLSRAESLLHSTGPSAALPLATRALGEFRKDDDKAGAMRALRLIGNCRRVQGEYALALESLDAALDPGLAQGLRLDEGKVLSLRGLVHWETGDYERAERDLQQAIGIARQIGAAQLEASALNNLGLIDDERGRYTQSLAAYERALALYEQDTLARGISDTLSNIGGVNLMLGRYRDALVYYERALALDTAQGNAPATGTDHGNIALATQGLGDYAQALRHAELALAGAHAAGQAVDEAFWLKARAGILQDLGQYDQALRSHRRAIARYESAGATGEFIEASAEFGELLLRLGDLAGAEAQFARALAMARRIGHHRGETQSLMRLGDLQAQRRQFDVALQSYNTALQRAASVDDRAAQAEAQVQLALLAAERGDTTTANRHVNATQALLANGEQPTLEARAQLLAARLAADAGEFERASSGYASALGIAEQLGDPDLLWRSHFGRASVRALSGDVAGAIVELESAVTVIEGVRSRLQQGRYRSGYLEDKYEVYAELVRLLLQSGDVRRAFSVSEDLRAQSYAEMLQRTGGPAAPGPDEAAALERIRALQEHLATEQALPRAERRDGALHAYSQELVRAERAYSEMLDEREDGGAVAVRAGISDAEVQASLEPGEALLEYVVGGRGLVAFVVTADALHATHVPLQRRELRAKTELLRELVEHNAGGAWKAPARSLAQSLIAPLESRGWLRGIDNLFVVPDAELNYLPFALLPRASAGRERLLVQDFVLQTLPAAAMLLRGPAAPAVNDRLLALAPSIARLKHAGAEASAIAAMHGSNAQLWTGSAASERQFKHRAGSFGILHLATHGHFNSLNPAFSALELQPGNGEDGKLQVREIQELRLRAALVTLSACNTALGSGHFSDTPAGNEFIGLSRAFLQAGSHGVLSSLWSVDDRFTSTLMVDVYAHAAGTDYAGGLAQAQRRVIAAGGEYSHPYYWAPYVLVSSSSANVRAGGKVARLSVQSGQ